MIENLTKAQERQIEVYEKKAFAMAYDTVKGDEEKAKEAIIKIYAWENLPAPEVVFVDSPLAVQNYLNNRFKTTKFWDFACYGEGGLEGYWLMFYKYFEDVVPVGYTSEEIADLNTFIDFVSNSSFCVQLENLVVISRKPTRAEHDINGFPHCENAKAYEWADGDGDYYLHGVLVPAWLVLTPADEIDIKKVIEEENSEVRREIIRKVGIQKMLEAGKGKEVDKRKRIFKRCDIEGQKINLVKGGNWWQAQQGDVCIEYDPKIAENPLPDYDAVFGEEKTITESLWDIDCGTVNGVEVWARYIVLENPSLEGVLHFEGVIDACKTVQEAHNWRKYQDVKKEWNPGQIS